MSTLNTNSTTYSCPPIALLNLSCTKLFSCVSSGEPLDLPDGKRQATALPLHLYLHPQPQRQGVLAQPDGQGVYAADAAPALGDPAPPPDPGHAPEHGPDVRSTNPHTSSGSKILLNTIGTFIK